MANDCWGPNFMERRRDDGPEHVLLLEKHLGSLVTWLGSKGGEATFSEINHEFKPSQVDMYDEDFREAWSLGMTTGKVDLTLGGDGMTLELSDQDF